MNHFRHQVAKFQNRLTRQVSERGKEMYAQTIKQFSPNHDPRQIEAFMRLQYSTLDHLSLDDFEAEGEIARECIDADPKAAEILAQSFGL